MFEHVISTGVLWATGLSEHLSNQMSCSPFERQARRSGSTTIQAMFPEFRYLNFAIKSVSSWPTRNSALARDVLKMWSLQKFIIFFLFESKIVKDCLILITNWFFSSSDQWGTVSCQTWLQRERRTAENGHSDAAPSVDDEAHRTQRVSKWSHEQRHGDGITDDFAELFKINQRDLSTSSVPSLHCLYVRYTDLKSMFPCSNETKNFWQLLLSHTPWTSGLWTYFWTNVKQQVWCTNHHRPLPSPVDYA